MPDEVGRSLLLDELEDLLDRLVVDPLRDRLDVNLVERDERSGLLFLYSLSPVWTSANFGYHLFC